MNSHQKLSREFGEIARSIDPAYGQKGSTMALRAYADYEAPTVLAMMLLLLGTAVWSLIHA